MSALPDLTVCMCTYKRPFYGVITLNTLVHKLNYAGHKKFHVADGGSTEEELDAYKHILTGQDFSISTTDNLSDQLNACASIGGDTWLVTLDDFRFGRRVDITPDVNFLLNNQDVGSVRMGRLAFWEHGEGEEIHAHLRMLGGLHWWVIEKDRSNHPYICSINTTLYHRRFWDTYGDISPCPVHIPGDAELNGASRYNNQGGPTIAIPMRFGEDCGDWNEPVDHFGAWRSDEYTAAGGGRRM